MLLKCLFAIIFYLSPSKYDLFHVTYRTYTVRPLSNIRTLGCTYVYVQITRHIQPLIPHKIRSSAWERQDIPLVHALESLILLTLPGSRPLVALQLHLNHQVLPHKYLKKNVFIFFCACHARQKYLSFIMGMFFLYSTPLFFSLRAFY